MLSKRFQQLGDRVPLGRLTGLSFQLIDFLDTYKLAYSSLLEALVDGNARVTQRHLHKLFHHDYVKRFSLEPFGFSKELIYYLDNGKALRELAQRRGLPLNTFDLNRLRYNRERPYIDFNDTDPEKRAEVLGRLHTVHHELAISRFHGTLELACQGSEGAVRLKAWLQGKKVNRYVEAPEMEYEPQRQVPSEPGNDASEKELKPGWIEGLEKQRLPWRPDAFFLLGFRRPEAEPELDLGFAYEYQKTTETAHERLFRKYRAHFQFVVQDKPLQYFGVKRLRAVLTETPNIKQANFLRKLTQDPIVSKPPSPLFLFTSAEFFRKLAEIRDGQSDQQPTDQAQGFWPTPASIFKPIWSNPVSKYAVSLFDH